MSKFESLCCIQNWSRLWSKNLSWPRTRLSSWKLFSGSTQTISCLNGNVWKCLECFFWEPISDKQNPNLICIYMPLYKYQVIKKQHEAKWFEEQKKPANPNAQERITPVFSNPIFLLGTDLMIWFMLCFFKDALLGTKIWRYLWGHKGKEVIYLYIHMPWIYIHAYILIHIHICNQPHLHLS